MRHLNVFQYGAFSCLTFCSKRLCSGRGLGSKRRNESAKNFNSLYVSGRRFGHFWCSRLGARLQPVAKDLSKNGPYFLFKQVAQLYSVAEASKNETGGGEGVEVIKNEPYEDVPLLGGKFNKGQYTYKIYHLASKVPQFVRMIAPKGSLEIHEEAWNAYPYCKTVLSNPGYMKDNFFICVETYHFADRGTSENLHELPGDKLKHREIVHIDIANDPISRTDFKLDEDPTKFKSDKTGRGPLTGDWMKTVDPVMTCYKLVTAEFKWFGLQVRVLNVFCLKNINSSQP